MLLPFVTIVTGSSGSANRHAWISTLGQGQRSRRPRAMDIQEVLIPKSSDSGSFGPRPLDPYVASLNRYSSSLSFRRLTDVLGILHHLFYNSIIGATRICITRRVFFFFIDSPYGFGSYEMKRRYTRDKSQPASNAVLKTSSSIEAEAPCAPPSKIRRQGSRLLSALKSMTSRSHGMYSSTGWSTLPHRYNRS